MFSLLTAFFLSQADADWGWWVLFWVVFIITSFLQLLGIIKIVNKR